MFVASLKHLHAPALNQGGYNKAFGLSRQPIVVFLLFASNGPVISLVGQIRVAEIAILLVTIVNFSKMARSLRKPEITLVAWFMLSAFSYLLLDAVNQGIEVSTLKRVSTYIILGALVLSIKWLIGDSARLLVAALLGFALSFAIVLVFNIQVPSASYHLVPWRLGLGMAATLAVTTLIVIFPRLRILGFSALAFLILIHLAQNSRNLAMMTTITLVITAIAYLFGSPIPRRVNLSRYVKYGVVGILTIFMFPAISSTLTGMNVLPEEMQQKMESQLSNQFGIVAAARPDVFASIYGITKKPFTGYGSSTVDPEVIQFYAAVAAASFRSGADQIYRYILEDEPQNGTPSHSHLFGAWVDAGILAAISWFVVGLLCFRTLVQAASYKNVWTPLVVLIASATLWNILFSPGPIRLEMALSIVVLLFVGRKMTVERQNWLLRRSALRGAKG